jgi:hypothetical protein
MHIHVGSGARRSKASAFRPCSRAQRTTNSPNSTALDASQSNRTITNPLIKYQACPYERRLVAMPPSIIHAQCQSLRTHNVRVHRAAANDVDLKYRATRGSVCNALLSSLEPLLGHCNANEVDFLLRSAKNEFRQSRSALLQEVLDSSPGFLGQVQSAKFLLFLMLFINAIHNTHSSGSCNSGIFRRDDRRDGALHGLGKSSKKFRLVNRYFPIRSNGRCSCMENLFFDRRSRLTGLLQRLI